VLFFSEQGDAISPIFFTFHFPLKTRQALVGHEQFLHSALLSWRFLTISKSLIEWMETPAVCGHDLASLSDMFASAMRRKFGQEVPNWITSRIKEIAAIDPN
jgi:hypothetical protein